MKHWPNMIIIAVSAVLMQWHSIAFWQQYAGPTGVGFSLALEVVALWLWWQRSRWLAVVASCLLVGGPLIQLSMPLLTTMAEARIKTESTQRLINSYQAEIQQLSQSLKHYDNNSVKRLGWATRIDNTQTELKSARQALRTLVQDKTHSVDQLYLVVLMQALALMVIMRAQILAVTALPLVSSSKPVMPRPTTPKPVRQQSAQIVRKKTPATINKETTDFDRRVQTVVTNIRSILPRYEGKQRMLADEIAVRPADISMALNHIDRKTQGKETISEPALQKIETAMEVIHE